MQATHQIKMEQMASRVMQFGSCQEEQLSGVGAAVIHYGKMIRPLFRSLEKKVKEEVNGDKEAAADSGAEKNRLEVVLGENLCEFCVGGDTRTEGCGSNVNLQHQGEGGDGGGHDG